MAAVTVERSTCAPLMPVRPEPLPKNWDAVMEELAKIPPATSSLYIGLPVPTPTLSLPSKSTTVPAPAVHWESPPASSATQIVPFQNLTWPE